MKISAIVVVAGNDIERYTNLIQLLKAIKSQTTQPYELIIVEQCLKDNVWYYDKIPIEINNTKHIRIKFQEHQNLFSVGWGRNVGIYNATGDVVVCIDVDYVFGNDYFESISNKEINNSCVGWSKIYYIHEPEKVKIIQDNTFPVGRENFINTATIENGNVGGVQIFNRDWFLNNIVGYCEDIFGWGADDNDVYGRSRIISGEWYILDSTIYHLHHHYKQKDLLNNHRIKERNWGNPILVAQLMREKGVANLEHPNPIYPDSIKEAESESFGNGQ